MEFETDHAYVLLVIVASYFLNFWLSFKVSTARDKYGVKLPKMYAVGAEGETEKGRMFNCYQRAHQNFLESYASFLITMVLLGVTWPVVASGLGALWVVARVIYAFGYYTGNPSARTPGSLLALISYLSLNGCLVYIAVNLLRA